MLADENPVATVLHNFILLKNRKKHEQHHLFLNPIACVKR